MKPGSNRTISFEFPVSIPVEQVWKAWTDPGLILQWIGSDPLGVGIAAVMDVRPGGSYTITFQNSDRTEYTFFGKYLEVEYLYLLSFTWTWENEPGTETLARLRLKPIQEGTLLQFSHEGLAANSQHNYQQGWTSTFKKLKKMLGLESRG